MWHENQLIHLDNSKHIKAKKFFIPLLGGIKADDEFTES